jgi:hypothetical protein
MRSLGLLWLVLLAVPGLARAEVRIGASLHGTARTYHNSVSDESHRGLGPGLSLDLMQSPRNVGHGFHFGLFGYDEDHNNEQAHSRIGVMQLHYYLEHAFQGGAVGAGIGFDHVSRRHYDVTGAYSYTDSDTFVAMNVQLALDVHTTANGSKLGVVAGFAVFPLVDVVGIISGGEGGVNWRGVSASLGLFWQPH